MFKNASLGHLFITLIIGTVVLYPADAAGAGKEFSAKSGSITVPDETRKFLQEFSELAKKYSALVERSSIGERLCEMNPKCFYVQSWTACCCEIGTETTCEAPWPPK